MKSFSFRVFTLNSLWIHYLVTKSLGFDYKFSIFWQIYSLPIHFEFTIFWRIISDLTMSALSISRFGYEFTFFSWIHYDLTMNSLFFCDFSMIWLLIHYLLMNSLWFDYESTIGYPTSLWIYCLLFRDSTMKSLSISSLTLSSLSISRKDYELTIRDLTKTIFLANLQLTLLFEIWLWLHYQFPDSTMCYLFRKYILNSICFSRIHYEFIICSRIYYVDFSIYISIFDYESTINFLMTMNAIDLIMSSIVITRFDFEFIIRSAYSRWTHYLFENSLWAH